MENPYLNKVEENDYEQDGVLSIEGYKRGKESPHTRMELISEYSWAIPNEEAILTIVDYSPIIEIGAGTGYWASLVEKVGGDIIATDDMSREDQYNSEFFNVLDRNAKIASEYPERTLFLCWPEYDDPMGETALKSYEGENVILVGEDMGGCTGCDGMYRELGSNWEIVEDVSIPNWYGIKDYLQVYERI